MREGRSGCLGDEGERGAEDMGKKSKRGRGSLDAKEGEVRVGGLRRRVEDVGGKGAEPDINADINAPSNSLVPRRTTRGFAFHQIKSRHSI
jgi:hypothetical protein